MPIAANPRAAPIIFDCDGVLIDSESIALALLRDTLADTGLDLPLAEVQGRFQGRSLATVVADLREHWGHAMPSAAIARMGEALLQRFTASLLPVPGMIGLVDALERPVCVASSSHTVRLRHSLTVTDFARRFEPHVFSADAVGRGKPAPDLFLHAAARMGVEPARCLVIEDSVAGIEAARAAGMDAIGFTGGSHARGKDYAARLLAAGASRIATGADDLKAVLDEA